MYLLKNLRDRTHATALVSEVKDLLKTRDGFLVMKQEKQPETDYF
jgi:predicted metal-binding protein